MRDLVYRLRHWLVRRLLPREKPGHIRWERDQWGYELVVVRRRVNGEPDDRFDSGKFSVADLLYIVAAHEGLAPKGDAYTDDW